MDILDNKSPQIGLFFTALDKLTAIIKQPNYQADQRRYAQKVAKSITAVPPGHKTLEPCLHLKHAILLNTGVPQKPKSRPLRC